MERRRHVRHHRPTTATLVHEGFEQRVLVRDVSAGGAFVLASEPPLPGAHVDLTLWPRAGEGPPVTASALVGWVLDEGVARVARGFGCSWVSLRCAALAPLRRVLDELIEAERGFVNAVYDHDAGSQIYRYFAPSDCEADDEIVQVPALRDSNSRIAHALSHHWAFYPISYRYEDHRHPGTVVQIEDNALCIEAEGPVPRCFDTVDVRLGIDTRRGLLPVDLRGAVTLSPPKGEGARFWMRVTQVDEHGRDGLYQGFMAQLAAA